MRHLSIRGRNMLFLTRALEILRFDTSHKSLREYKSAFTPQAVKEINEAIVDLWPHDLEITTALQSLSCDPSGLYLGDYSIGKLTQEIVQHSLYTDKILLIDPFLYPYSVREEYNPILYPEKYCTQTLLNMNIWLNLAPWVEKGIVEFIRSPSDFDSSLKVKLFNLQKDKFEKHKELKAVLDESVKQMTNEFMERDAFRYQILMQPDSMLRKTFRQLRLGDEKQEDMFIQHIQRLREADPNYLEPREEVMHGGGEFHIKSSGVGYEEAKIISGITGSFLITDLPSRLKEIELDHAECSLNNEWSTFAKAIERTDLKFLNNVEINHALKLRCQGRLCSVRTFMKKVWKYACSGTPCGEKFVQSLVNEFEKIVFESEVEWQQIERDLLNWVGKDVGQVISPGNATFFAAPYFDAGASSLVTSKTPKIGSGDKCPAAIFVRLKEE